MNGVTDRMKVSSYPAPTKSKPYGIVHYLKKETFQIIDIK